ANMDVAGPETRHRSADGDSRHGILRQRRVKDPVAPKSLLESSSRALDCLVIVDVQAERNTRGSRSISLAMPSRRASTYRSRRPGRAVSLLGEYIGIKLLRRRKRTLFGKLDSFGDLPFSFGLKPLQLSRVQFSSDSRDLIDRLPSNQFLPAAVS